MKVVIIGVSADQNKYGYRSMKAHLDQGHEVYAVHPALKSLLGQPVYSSLADITVEVDRVMLYVPAEVGITILDQLSALRGTPELWVSPGAESEALLEKARSLGYSPIQACSMIDIQNHV